MRLDVRHYLAERRARVTLAGARLSLVLLTVATIVAGIAGLP